MHYSVVARILAFLAIGLGLAMLPCLAMDLITGEQHYGVFAQSAGLVLTFGILVVLATQNRRAEQMGIREAFLLTTGTWVLLPMLGAIPLMLGASDSSFTDAYFESVSGMTTTGSTIFVKIEELPASILLWRGIMQWLGGLGIIVVAMIFLPVMRVGGMQFFRSEGFDTLGKMMPRAPDIARGLLEMYIGLTVLCAIGYALFGMAPFDAAVHAMTTIATGGFANSDASFAIYEGPLEYVSSVFMFLASLPFIRFVQLTRGQAQPILSDVQIRAYVKLVFLSIGSIILYRMMFEDVEFLHVLRETVFNVITLFSGTGYASEDITTWGAFPFTVIFFSGLVGGCTASTACSIKVFRWLVVWEAIKTQVRRIQSPNAILRPKLGQQVIGDDVIDSVIAFFILFVLSFGLLTVALELTGLHVKTAITAAWTSIANIGPAFGPEVAANGAMNGFPEAAKWLMIFGMLVGRLEILSVYLLFTRKFWRD
ncbi:TrkH family potassium uptake protein [Thalassovita sp.]|uniref:TrkH family potassium uptake protein n=1 Tax=Thalassovita sp. TaxID=1979401 RepID=UPI0029DE7442|nr:TrkH family potassium uptake protein [Thalassovita sp.]